ncbi:hypothetical protein L7F22_016835 [Adiantum nelumboides]|nr:hypothetical protein [Adiantum nelumboides]
MLNLPSFLETVGMVIMQDDTPTASPQHHSSYKVIVAGNHDMSEDIIFTEVFDSTTGQWEATSTMPRGADPMLSAVACNGSLYSWCCEPDGLLTYNLKYHSWTLLPTSSPHSTLVSNAIISWQGRLFMLGGLNENQTTTSISIWELVLNASAKATKWVIFDTMPSSLLQEFLGGRSFFLCVACEGLVLLHVGACSPEMPMLLYDITKKSWQKLPLCPLLVDRVDDALIDGIAFTPLLCAIP